MTDRASTGYDGLRCEVCGGGAFAPRVRGVVDYLSGETFDILACAGCGLGVTWPLVPDAPVLDGRRSLRKIVNPDGPSTTSWRGRWWSFPASRQ